MQIPDISGLDKKIVKELLTEIQEIQDAKEQYELF
jgi:hypothetical protein